MNIFKRHTSQESALTARWRRVSEPSPHRSLALSGRISYVEATQLREVLFRMIGKDAPRDLVVELGAVDKIDTAGVAVLVESLAAARSLDQRLLLCEPADTVRAIFQLAGLTEALQACCGCPADVGARLTADDN